MIVGDVSYEVDDDCVSDDDDDVCTFSRLAYQVAFVCCVSCPPMH